jgi:hypothetical protein
MNQRGISFLEVLVTGALLQVIVLVAMNASQMRKGMETKDKLQSIARGLIMQTATEIHAKLFADLPAPQNCLVRRYSLKGAYESETTHPIADTTCSGTTAVSTQGKLFVISRFRPFDATDPEWATLVFGNSQYMTPDNTIYSVEIEGYYPLKIDMNSDRSLKVKVLKRQ